MLITIQFPIADSRSFVKDKTYKLTVPSWTTLIPDHDFVRSFGVIRRRPQGGLSGWLGESMICEANHAVRFQNVKPFQDNIGNLIKFKVVFKRFYFDGLAVGKFEIGLAVWGFKKRKLSSHQTRELFHHILQLPVVVPNPFGQNIQCALCQAGQPLTKLYAVSSSFTEAFVSGQENSKDWWVQPCEPIIVVIYDPEKEKLQIPFWGKYVRLDTIDEVLAHHIIPNQGKNLRMWMISESWSWNSLRQLRIYLLRLHAERTCLKQILRNIASEKLMIPKRSPQSNTLQHYLNVSIHRIKRLNEHSNTQSEAVVAELAREAEDFIVPGEIDSLIEALNAIDMRKNIFNKVEDYVQKQIIIKEQIMGDKYTIGQAGAVGPHSQAHDMTFNQIWNQTSGEINLPTLVEELSQLRTQLKKEATEAEHDVAIGEIALAEVAAKDGNGPKVLEHLAKAGKWAFDIATKIGVAVASAALKSALGF